MPRNDQAVRQLVILNKLEASRHGLTLAQLADAIDPAAIRHPRTLRRDLEAIEAVGWPLVTELHASLQSALGKASAALPPQGVELAQQLEHTFSVGLGPHKRYKHHREVVERLTRAIADKTRIQMRYDSASRGRVTRREVDPYRRWYAVQYECTNTGNPAVPFAPLGGGSDGNRKRR
jgi:predicted DNA-binding transcriptional regulator YafY